MDQKHRDYCIKLGNTYMNEENNKVETETSSWNNSFEIPVEDNNEDNWLKNSKKFTN